MLADKRGRRGLMNQINVVPYIDVMLVLLVIFMVTAPLTNPGQVELPQMGKTSHLPIAPMEISIHADESLWLRDDARGTAALKVSRDEALRLIREKQQKNPDQPVVIAADKNVRYEAVLEVMDMLQQNQVRKVGLLARPRNR